MSAPSPQGPLLHSPRWLLEEAAAEKVPPPHLVRASSLPSSGLTSTPDESSLGSKTRLHPGASELHGNPVPTAAWIDPYSAPPAQGLDLQTPGHFGGGRRGNGTWLRGRLVSSGSPAASGELGAASSALQGPECPVCPRSVTAVASTTLPYENTQVFSLSWTSGHASCRASDEVPGSHLRISPLCRAHQCSEAGGGGSPP